MDFVILVQPYHETDKNHGGCNKNNLRNGQCGFAEGKTLTLKNHWMKLVFYFLKLASSLKQPYIITLLKLLKRKIDTEN